METALFSAPILFAGALLQGLAGFGGALFSMPLLLLFVDPKWAAPVVVLCYTINRIPALFVLRKDLMWDHSLLLIAAAAPGAFLGTYFLKSLEPGVIMKTLGTVLVLYSAYRISAPGFRLNFSRIWAVPTGFLSGVLGGAFGTDGPPVVVYATLKPWSKEQVIGMLQSFFLFANFIVIGSYGYHGLLDASVFTVSAVSAPFAVAGIFLGLRINRRIRQRHFEIVVSCLIGIMGLVLWMR
ncbi:MAG: Sulfite exporter TauE/SafE [Syntrophaceae bacterium PtaU1.Bin231]|nr:MAG: Sulfite exporter TauE/SafE [Syntrophaceae bacterium PtaU1.Bin231]